MAWKFRKFATTPHGKGSVDAITQFDFASTAMKSYYTIVNKKL